MQKQPKGRQESESKINQTEGIDRKQYDKEFESKQMNSCHEANDLNAELNGRNCHDIKTIYGPITCYLKETFLNNGSRQV